MNESSYKTLKEKALSILTFKNRNVSFTIFGIVNTLFALTIFFKYSFTFLISMIFMAITMVALFYGFYKQAFASEQTPYSATV